MIWNERYSDKKIENRPICVVCFAWFQSFGFANLKIYGICFLPLVFSSYLLIFKVSWDSVADWESEGTLSYLTAKWWLMSWQTDVGECLKAPWRPVAKRLRSAAFAPCQNGIYTFDKVCFNKWITLLRAHTHSCQGFRICRIFGASPFSSLALVIF